MKEIVSLQEKRSETASDSMLQIPAGYEDSSFNILKIVLSSKGFHVDSKSFEEDLDMRTGNGEYNLLAELLSDHNNSDILFTRYRGLTEDSILQNDNYGRTSLIYSYLQLNNRLASENVCSVDTTARPRKETYLFDLDAVNEALLISLLYNDWTINAPLINMFDDRIVILSHGGIPANQTKEMFLRGTGSPRNKALMRILEILEMTEESFNGIQKIIDQYGEESFDIEDSYMKVTIPFTRIIQRHRI